MRPPKICAECKRPFEGCGDTCTQCLIKPSAQEKPSAPEKPMDKKTVNSTKEKSMAQPNCPAQKICVDCSKPYKPTSNVQKRCPACRKVHDKNVWREYSKKKLSADHEAPHAPFSGTRDL